MTEPRSPQQIVDECLKLADTFYVMHGMISRPGFKYYDSPHPMEQAMWNLAVCAYDHIEGTEVGQCLDEIEECGEQPLAEVPVPDSSPDAPQPVAD